MELFFRTEGNLDNSKLIILHGLYGMSDNWMSLAKRYGQHFYVILPDLRNHGLSPHHHVHTYTAMKEDIIQLISKLNIHHTAIMGHSMGGKIAMLVALETPAIVTKLVIADIGPGMTPRVELHKNIAAALMSINPEKYGSRQEIGAELSMHIQDDAIVQLMLKNLGKSKEGYYFWKPNVKVILENLSHIAGPIPLEGFYTHPSLLIKGEKSKYVSDDDLEHLLKYFLLLEEYTLTDAGHWLHADNPEGFYRVTTDFLLKR